MGHLGTPELILILVIVVLSTQLFSLKRLVQDQLLGGLFDNFVLMDQAHIKTTIPVSASVPAKFDLPLQTNTTVILTEDTAINGARVNLWSTHLILRFMRFESNKKPVLTGLNSAA